MNVAGEPRHYLMCEPTHYDVTYAINPWMASGEPVDTAAAYEQWDSLRELFSSLGARVEVVPGVAGLPDMVFAANAGTVVDGTFLPARFLHPERRGEEVPYRRWFEENGYVVPSDQPPVNEGEGDLLLVGDLLLAGHGFRSDPAVRPVAEVVLGRPSIALRLVDERFYHLDTALAVLDDTTIAYYPPAFDDPSRAVLAERFPEAILADEADATAFGLNVVSDGHDVVLAEGAHYLVSEIRDRGFSTHEVDMGEFVKSGGAVKCCTLMLR